MHLVFERTNGRFKSNCNILALAWMPYYVETKFRRALFDYHQLQLINLPNISNNNNNNNQPPVHLSNRHANQSAPTASGNQQQDSRVAFAAGPQAQLVAPHGVVGAANNSEARLAPQSANAQSDAGSRLDETNNTPNNHNINFRSHRTENGNQANNDNSHSDINNLRLNQSHYSSSNPSSFLNSRLAELNQRYYYAKDFRKTCPNNLRPSQRNNAKCSAVVTADSSGLSLPDDELDAKYGRMSDFGWLVIGHISKTVGITLTSVVSPPDEIEESKLMNQNSNSNKGNTSGENSNDLIVFDANEDDTQNGNNNNDSGCDLAASKSSSFCSTKQSKHTCDYERFRPDRKCVRSNYNLRGHLDEVIIVKWNELYQKLATVDTKGNVLIWCKINEKFTVQTPFYNRTKTVADFCWSNDGKTALICYTDAFILVGSSSGQRHWHSMLNLDDYHITCATWTPNDEQLLLGVSNGNVLIIDLARSELVELVLADVNVRTMCWSSSEMNLRHVSKTPTSSGADERLNFWCLRRYSSATASCRNSTVVSQRRLSRDCSVFSRARNGFNQQQQQQQQQTQNATPSNNVATTWRNRSDESTRASADDHLFAGRGARAYKTNGLARNILAVDLADNTIRLYENGLDDPEAETVRVDLESYTMHWSGDGRVLAVAGFNIHTSTPSIGCLRCKYVNEIKFYDQRGRLIYKYRLKHTRYPLTAFTWAHDDTRIFLATGPNLHCAKVYFGVPSLSLLAASCFQRHTRLPDKIDVLQSVLRNQFSASIINWQSFNCPFDLGTALKSRHSSNSFATVDLSTSSSDDTSLQYLRPEMRNNVNLYRYQLPAKVLSKIDDLFALSIRQPFEEHLAPTDIVWQVPNNNQRHYCTLVCYSNENEISSSGYNRYGHTSEPQDRPTTSAPLASTNYTDQTTDQYKIFILYVEFQGSLIPILKARRVGFLKPEFVIFDPEDRRSKQRRCSKISDSFQAFNRTNENNSRHLSDLISQAHAQRQYFSLEKGALSRASSPGPLQLKANCKKRFDLMVMRDFAYKNNLDPTNGGGGGGGVVSPIAMSGPMGISDTATSNLYQSPFGEHQHRRSSMQSHSSRNRSSNYRLPETNEIARIRSNIWGTKFKIVNVSNSMIEQKALLGTVVYKASLLHLQPRQVFLYVKNMSNYCTLCSTHHHSKMVTASGQSHASSLATKDMSLIDMPNNLLEFASSQRDAPSRGDKDDKIIVPIGDGIRVAPKLENNQVYRALNSTRTRRDTQAPSSTSHLPRTLASQTGAAEPTRAPTKRHSRDRSGRSAQSKNTHNLSHESERNASSAIHLSHTDRYNAAAADVDDARGAGVSLSNRTRGKRDDIDESCNSDILTLSLGQGDQLRVEMKSLETLAQPSGEDKAELEERSDRMDEFLASNKTLKSIQAITKMIVDLSSKVDTDNEEDTDVAGECAPDTRDNKRADEPEAFSTPTKLIRLSSASSSPTAARAFVAPEAPVHRPRRNPVSTVARGAGASQSATTTPLRRDDPRRRPVRLRSRGSNAGAGSTSDGAPLAAYAIQDAPLPLPPSVPLGRRISSKARRLIDGSLRSLYSASGANAGYLSSSEAEPEEFEPLVARSRRQRAHKHSGVARSRPSSSARTSTAAAAAAATASLSSSSLSWLPNTSAAQSLQSQLMQKLRGQAGWQLTSTGSLARDKRRSSRSGCNSALASPSRGASAASGPHDEQSMDDLYDSTSDSDDDDDDFERLESGAGVAEKRAPGRFSSVKNLSHIGGSGADKPPPLTPSAGGRDRRQHLGGSKRNCSGGSNPHSRRQQTSRRSVCLDASCCCAHEFKLRNRPPVWNEFSQVYQLDFGGRVTQESAKNLQIDFNGSLALQFGRIDRCTYALDYKHPFNAIQAMAIALASLTQRLK